MSNFQFNCHQCGFISRLCRHEMDALNAAQDAAVEALQSAAHHLNDQCDPFHTARNMINAAIAKFRPDTQQLGGKDGK